MDHNMKFDSDRAHDEASAHGQHDIPHGTRHEVPPSKDPHYDDGLVHDHGWASSERGAARHRL